MVPANAVNISGAFSGMPRTADRMNSASARIGKAATIVPLW